MRLATYITKDEPAAHLGILEDNVLVDVSAIGGPATLKDALRMGSQWQHELHDHLVRAKRDGTFVGASDPLETCTLLPPVPDPAKFICVGKNYPRHLAELVRADLLAEVPDEPTGFIKLNSVLVGDRAEVRRPPGIVEFDYEPELTFVIGLPAYQVSKKEAMGYVAGITVFNDLTAREVQRREQKSGTRFWTAKNMPGFGPVGPFLVTLDEIADVNDLWLTCSVNGNQRVRFNTSEMIFKVPDIIEHFSRFLPLEAGDTFSTGAPGGVALADENAKDLFLKPGDTVEVCIESVLCLQTHIT